jgi:hypothetical protein
MSPDRRLLLYAVGAGEPEPVRGALAGDLPIRFSPDGRALYVQVRGDGPASAIDRIELSSGQRSTWKEVGPPTMVGTLGIPRVFLSADGQSYVYTYVRLLDELFLVDGLK